MNSSVSQVIDAEVGDVWIRVSHNWSIKQRLVMRSYCGNPLLDLLPLSRAIA